MKKVEVLMSVSDKGDYTSSFLPMISESAGQGLGALISLLIGGPMGVITGSAIAPPIARAVLRVLVDHQQRHLSRIEEQRTNKVVIYMLEKARQNQLQGQDLRADWFSEADSGAWGTAEEIFDAVMTTAQRTYQDKKLPFLAVLGANFIIRPELSEADVNLLRELASRLSYRQLCLIALFAQKDKFSLKITDFELTALTSRQLALLQEIYDLEQQYMLGISGNGVVGIAWSSLMTRLEPAGMGERLYTLMELWNIEESEITEIAKMLTQ